MRQKNHIYVIVVIAMHVGECVSIGSSQCAANDWPRFLGPSADGKSDESGIMTRWPANGPPVEWTLELGDGYGACSIQNGKLFQCDAISEQSRLRCLGADTGRLFWSFQYRSEYTDIYGYGPGPRSAPVVDGDRVYLFGVEGMLHCLRTKDGSVIWKVDTQQQFGVVQNFFGVGSTPCIYEDKLIVMVGGSPVESQRVPPGQLDLVSGNGSAIVAFDKLTGAVQYQLSNELASYASPRLASWDGTTRCLAFLRGGLLIFDPRTGQQEYHHPWRAKKLESVNASNPVVVGREILISETYGLGSVLLRHVPSKGYETVWSDAERRRDKSLQTHWNTPIYHDGSVYGSSGRHKSNAELRCVEWNTGEVRWSVPDLTRCSLLYVDGHFVCLGENGDLRLFRANPARYEEVAVARLIQTEPIDGHTVPLLEEPAWAAPLIANGLLYVRGSHRLVCMRLIPLSF